MPLAIAQAKRKRLLSILLDLQRAAHLDRLQSRAELRWIHSLDPRPRASHYVPWPIHENNLSRVFASMDALASIPTYPAHWTDEQRREFVERGYVLEVDDRAQRKSPPVTLYYNDGGRLTPDEVREFVPPQYIYPTVQNDAAAQADRIVTPSYAAQQHAKYGTEPVLPKTQICSACQGDPVANDGSICSACNGACVI